MRRISGLDDLARIFFPDNRNHRRAFIAIWVETKYAERQFLPDMKGIESEYGLSRRTIENVRAKMKKLGLIKRISHFNPEFGYRAGWTFSGRFRQALGALAGTLKAGETVKNVRGLQERKDRDAILYV
ncbi:MAG: hypothetical protein HN742_37410 [Lentisphaerae bacterium]|nr:hypothetical protein [Lentisphaerota bacterium]MBT4816497.1 hypothetical protein [Lentisphaerota bacterium]MBT5606085.1 hypothetical protein [Lentisphaerota bacterium]MBT7058640.1 hypothetical protein [Lentisphaerota bacterium]MBT7847607.1 hypothetical protein [Lentisphaerota bacterium]